jgi:hypothetical protein
MADWGGYDAHFIDSLPDRFVCPTCQLTLRDPTVTHCGHQFCQESVQPLRKRGHLLYPVCRTQLKETEICPNNSLKKKVLSLKIRCDQHKCGCDCIQELWDRAKHNKTCGYVYEQCKNKCGETILRKDKDYHLNRKCCKREVACPYCEEMMPHEYLRCHFSKC